MHDSLFDCPTKKRKIRELPASLLFLSLSVFLSAQLYLLEHLLSSEGFVLSTVLISRALLIRNATVWMLTPLQITFLKKMNLKMHVCVCP